MSELEKSISTLTEFNRLCASLESGRISLDNMANFLDNGGLDASTKAYLSQTVMTSLTDFTASFDLLLTALGLPTTSAPSNPQE